MTLLVDDIPNWTLSASKLRNNIPGTTFMMTVAVRAPVRPKATSSPGTTMAASVAKAIIEAVIRILEINGIEELVVSERFSSEKRPCSVAAPLSFMAHNILRDTMTIQGHVRTHATVTRTLAESTRESSSEKFKRMLLFVFFNHVRYLWFV